MLLNGPDNPKNFPFPWGSASPFNTWFLGPTQVFVQNGISIGSAVFAQLTVGCPITLQWAVTFSPKMAHPLRGSSPHVTLFLGPSPPIISNGISIGSAVLYGSQMLCYTMHCQWGRKPQKLLFPLGFRHPAGRGPSYGHISNMRKNLVKIAHVISEISSRTDRQTDSHTHTHTHTHTHANYNASQPRSNNIVGYLGQILHVCVCTSLRVLVNANTYDLLSYRTFAPI